jgi:hypothetical protein
MSEQPPRGSSQVPFASGPEQRTVHPDPEAPAVGIPHDAPPFAEPLPPHIVPADSEERIRVRTGDGLDRAADAARRLGHRARDQGGLAGHAEPIAYRVGDSLQSAATYVRGHDLVDMRDDVETNVRRSPLKALAFAALGGFLLGRMFR